MIVNIRYATMADLDDIASVESVCFPVLEAATKEEFEQRIKYFGNHFWLMFDERKLIAFVDGFVTDEANLTDEMYENVPARNRRAQGHALFHRSHRPAGSALSRDEGEYRHRYPGRLTKPDITSSR